MVVAARTTSSSAIPPVQVIDVVGAAVVFAIAVTVATASGFDGSGASRHAAGQQLDPFGVVLIVISILPILWWRRAPLGAYTVATVASLAVVSFDYPIGFPFGAAAALYLLAANRGHSSTRQTAAAVIVSLTAYLAVTAAVNDSVTGLQLSHTALACAVAWFAGERTRLRRVQMSDLHDRATRAERDAERDRRLAVAEERARIARDLHDSAAHAVNVIAVRAGAARLRHAAEPDRSRDALEAIEVLARRTVEDVDHIVGALRDHDDADTSARRPAGRASLDGLIATHTDTGLHVALRTSGTVRPVSTAADQAIFRIVQETLTNAARHGAGAAAVDLIYTDMTIDLTITNPIGSTVPARVGGGHGLVGMRERATLLGGTFDARADGHEFVVHATIPAQGESP